MKKVTKTTLYCAGDYENGNFFKSESEREARQELLKAIQNGIEATSYEAEDVEGMSEEEIRKKIKEASEKFHFLYTLESVEIEDEGGDVYTEERMYLEERFTVEELEKWLADESNQ